MLTMKEMETTKIFFGGDVCGLIGVKTLKKNLPSIIDRYGIDFVYINGENASSGVGIRPSESNVFFESGVDVITGGNHSLERFDLRDTYGKEPRILRPENYPFAKGSGIYITEKKSLTYIVINIQGREYMKPIDCPFQTLDRIYDTIFKQYPDALILVDIHAESSTEKEALGYYLDGRAALVAGSHTHTQTADEKILPNGTAYITDAGMIGARYSVIGGDPEMIIKRARTQVPQKFTIPEKGETIFSGIIAEIHNETKKAIAIDRIKIFDYID
ncbi:YmdB family metallophosphoesterase [Treponema phagedenis]|uniref:YmdB family metallophosphoesterase n=2 Tax=Treponema phagedenis TaxID=162 RepID=A0A0B7GTM3_TREPH|nr:YmdB family metallophosphoesterase [Treponema phagedenis]QEJ97785.1 YmdB family metallophosphoesterase [Treponema phagedenis]QEK01327.1 YmdB family metallophosphoesterase [Treponema phagedenis]QEK03351.1 YmdB family metallophosphoesterase [Treponema phagedenis]QEK06347.1 YmdB family metallophosphoesterase [Treponema phagedenis]